jgi:hypothetical protein
MREPQNSGVDLSHLPRLVSVCSATPAFTFATYRNVSIAVWRSTATVVALQRIDTYLMRLASAHAKFASVIVLEPTGFGAPDQHAREEHARLTKKYEDSSLGAAMIIDGQSVKDSLFRFVLTTIQLMSSPRVPQRIFPSVNSAANWISSLDGGLFVPDILAAIKEARTIEWRRAG